MVIKYRLWIVAALVSACALASRLPEDNHPADYTQRTILFTRFKEMDTWRASWIKVPAVNDATAVVCFREPTDRQVACFYTKNQSGETGVLLVTLDEERT